MLPLSSRPSSHLAIHALALLIVIGLWSPHGATAEQPSGRVGAARAAIEASDLEDAQRQAALANLDAAAISDRAAAAAEERRAALEAQAAQAERLPADVARPTDRDAGLADWEARLPADADAETLESLLARERSDEATLDARIDEAGADLAGVLARPAQAAEEMASLRQHLAELSTPPVVLEGEPAPVYEARRLRWDAERRQAQAELDLRRTEQETAPARQRLLENELRDMRRRLAVHEGRIAVLRRRIAEIARRTLEREADRLAAQSRELQSSDPQTALAARQNEALGRELVVQNERLEEERNALANLEKARVRIQESLRESRTRLEVGGASEEVGRWLWSERRRLASSARLEQRLGQVRDTLAQVRLRAILISEQQRDIEDLAEAARTPPGDAPSDDDVPDDIRRNEVTLRSLLRERAILLTRLAPIVQRRITALEQGERALQAEIERTVELRQILDRRLLWIPSHPGVDLAWVARVPEGMRDLVKPSRLLTTADLLAKDATARPGRYVVALLLLALALLLRTRAPGRITAAGALTRQIRQDRYRYTVDALAWTVAAALPGPVAVALVGVLLQGIGTAGRFSHSLGRTCVWLAPPLLAFTFLYWTNVEDGLAHAHFRWTRQRREALRRWVPRVALSVLPLAFVGVLAFTREQDLAIDVSARLAVVGVAGIGAWALWRLLDVGTLWSARRADDRHAPMRRLLRVVLSAGLLAIGLLALAGYIYSASMVVGATLRTFQAVVVIATVVGMLARWFLIGERKLKLRRLEAQRTAEPPAGPDGGEVARESDEDLTVEEVGAQTRRVLQTVRLALLAIALIWVWSGVLFAFARLDEFALWHVTDVGPDGSPVGVPVTLMAALLGVASLALTVVAARNLPGLVEIGLLSQAGIDAASRYAVTSVLRYAIVATGSIVGLALLGLRWSQLQWMAAALSVGLGFGLQEVFGNFVSGLILLFERPFRVGDVITIGDLSGRVTRIRTRATTILDWDNKELVVPNKTFITDRLINWTLSDTTTRVTIKLGVAYGTDPAKVHALLRDAARENPRVLPEPEPDSLFLAFGASSLDFELRVYVGALGDRLRVQDELHGRVAALCAERGVEIAFPQLDVHVRDVPAPPEGG